MPDLAGQYIGRYHILERLGEGGMATVYKAFDTRLEASVAIKVIRMDELPPKVLDRALKRFAREAKALARLTHPNIVRVIDAGEHEGAPYLVMPYLPGGSLKQVLRERGRLPWQEGLQLLIPIARALGYAHRQGMIHRDVKPSNILITEDAEPVLTDFGIAKILEDEATMDLTGTGMLVGTPEYMAPEQVSGSTVDARADIYALGVVLYEMVTGRKPYQADTPMAVMVKQARDPLPRPREFAPGLPEGVERILLKMLAKDPEERYQTMEELAAALERERVLDQVREIHRPSSPRRPSKPTANKGWWIGGSFAVLALLGGVLLIDSVILGKIHSRLVTPTATTVTTISGPTTGTLPSPKSTAVRGLVATIRIPPTDTPTLTPSPTETPTKTFTP
ncbi:MAG: serine/threonine protein kinase, partial [Armatimonadetes bacterium]|nr:serine/threonine protein kinase [Armatimonadota bacterium]